MPIRSRWIKRLMLLAGATLLMVVLLYSKIQPSPRTISKNSPKQSKSNIIRDRTRRSSTRSLLALNKVRMELLSQQYAKILNLSSFDQPRSHKTMVYSCRQRCKGWGDRIRGVMSVYILALLTRRRFMIDMNIPCPLSHFLQPNIVNWTFSEPKSTSDRKRTRLVISTTLFDEAENKRFDTLITSKNFISEWESYDDVWMTTNTHLTRRALRNPLANSSWLIGRLPPIMTVDRNIFPLLFELLFKPTKTLIQSVEKVLHLPYEQLVCVHIRMGQNPSNPRDSVFPFRQNITRTMIKFLDTKLGSVSAKSTRIFVASDSNAAINEVEKKFPGSVVTVPGPIMHIDREYSAKFRSSVKSSACEGFLKVLTEFLLLGECDVSILSRSGFSAWASRRRVKPDETVYLYNDTMQSIIRVKLNTAVPHS